MLISCFHTILHVLCASLSRKTNMLCRASPYDLNYLLVWFRKFKVKTSQEKVYLFHLRGMEWTTLTKSSCFYHSLHVFHYASRRPLKIAMICIFNNLPESSHKSCKIMLKCKLQTHDDVAASLTKIKINYHMINAFLKHVFLH